MSKDSIYVYIMHHCKFLTPVCNIHIRGSLLNSASLKDCKTITVVMILEMDRYFKEVFALMIHDEY